MNKQIAAELGDRGEDREDPPPRVMEKMRATSLADLVLMAHVVDKRTTKVRCKTCPNIPFNTL